MKDRIKQIRKELGLTQEQFCNDLGVSLGNIKFYETGRRTPSDAFIQLLCNKYNVNELWLRSGIGEMRVPMTREEEIAEITSHMFKEEESSLKFQLLLAISQATSEQLEKMVEAAEMIMNAANIAESLKKEDK